MRRQRVRPEPSYTERRARRDEITSVAAQVVTQAVEWRINAQILQLEVVCV